MSQIVIAKDNEGKYFISNYDEIKNNEPNAKKVVSEKTSGIVAFVKSIPSRIAKGVDTARDFVESKIHPEKFGA